MVVQIPAEFVLIKTRRTLKIKRNPKDFHMNSQFSIFNSQFVQKGAYQWS